MTETSSDFVFSPAPQPSVPVAGTSARFPVRRILCVGRNYAAHAREMGADPTREAPFFFAKPGDAVAPGGGNVPYPSATSDLHHEVELVVAIGGSGRDLTPEQASKLVFGWAVGVDLTRRDLQAEAKKAARPWDSAKGFDASAPISEIIPFEALPNPTGRIRLSIDGQARQDADLGDMIWDPCEVIAEASKLWQLAPGDLIFTGTPEGVGAIGRGEQAVAEIDGVGRLVFRMV
ncbi:fumarylacetoacetate hydrolase family protein [Caulobacter sp. 17J65-9]|uniref:fumarylacetoacetate hydrolase family protein n=1 Tax=Caulobacter sp. 17J65-9 TaxID=2709382 RepID=UPI0013C706CF|nr:fumarylacetoacetate hydrolase family protein [Caulobacter sp. 17J65-9]NEX92826.1 fumarylacetoacetate hydrolase family protein [Caulobacter sp. 17J65-9]